MIVNLLEVVVQQENNIMIMKTCILRMGRKGQEVDNSARGGVSVKVIWRPAGWQKRQLQNMVVG